MTQINSLLNMNRFLLFFAFICCAVANLDLPHPKTLQIESLVGFAGPDDTVLDNDPSSFAGAVVIDGVSQANGLDMDCNNKFCSMMRYAVVRKVFTSTIEALLNLILSIFAHRCVFISRARR